MMNWKRIINSDQTKRTLMQRSKSPYRDPQMARYYAEASAPYQFDQPARDLVTFLKISPSQKILDIGSGTGLIAAAASELCTSSGFVFALDSSLEMLKRQPKNRVIHIAASAQDLPFDDEIFDRIAAGFVITHLSDYSKGLSEWTRVLRSGGIMAVSAWELGATTVSDIWKSTIKQFLELTIVEEAFARVIPWDEFFSVRANLTKVFEKAGLINVRAETKSYLIAVDVRQYIDSKRGSVEGTIVRNQLDEKKWKQFLEKLTHNLQKEFPQRIEYSRNVHFASGKKSKLPH